MRRFLPSLLAGALLLAGLAGCGPAAPAGSSPAPTSASTATSTGTAPEVTAPPSLPGDPTTEDTTAAEPSDETRPPRGDTQPPASPSGTNRPPSSTNAATTKGPAPTVNAAVTKVVGANAGSGYFIVRPAQDHPGVVDMDATYAMQARDKAENYLPVSDMDITVNNAAVKIEGATLTVPYAVRTGSAPLTVTIRQKSRPNRTGTYTFDFQKFTAEPTLFEDFNAESAYFRSGEYEKGREGYASMDPGVIEDGNLVFRLEAGGPGGYRTTCGLFKQAYGCFSARIQMPRKALVNGAFWLCSEDGDIYIKNPQRPVQSGGELDVVEYFPTWGDERWAATIHWNGWSSYHQNAGKEPTTGSAIRGNYHIYSAVWTPTAIYWYFDGILSWTYTGEGVAPGSGPMQVMLQASNPGKDSPWGGKYDPTAFPDIMKTDWVKIYALAD